MSKLKELQEKNGSLLSEQEELINKGAEKDADGNERGWTPEQEARFEAIVEEREALVPQIETEKKKEQVRQELAGRQAPADNNFNIVPKEEPFALEKAVKAAVTGDWQKAGKERERMSQDPKWNEKRIILDPNMSLRADATSIAGTEADGGALVGTQHRPDKFIDALFNESILGRLPVVMNTGLTQNQSIPIDTSKPTATMVGEIDALPDSEKETTSLKTATPKEMVTKSAFSRRLDIQSLPNIRNILNNKILKVIAEKLDEMFIGGTGTAPVLQGILNKTSGGSVNVVSGAYRKQSGTNGSEPTYADLVHLFGKLGEANVRGNLNWIINNQMLAKFLKTLRDSANTNSGYIMTSLMDTPLGIPAVVSQSVPGAYTKGTGTNLSPIILGKFDETEVFQWGNIAVEFDSITKADVSQIVVRSYSFWDFIHARPENYAAHVDLITA